jgi:cytochrome b involved in lipid metabolism
MHPAKLINMNGSKRAMTMKEVSKHNKPDDMWMVLHGKVYDVTKFLEDHPGGTDIMIENAGTDVTNQFEEMSHTKEARRQATQFHIGDIEGYISEYRPAARSDDKCSSYLVAVVIGICSMLYIYSHW